MKSVTDCLWLLGWYYEYWLIICWGFSLSLGFGRENIEVKIVFNQRNLSYDASVTGRRVC